jgi:2-iminoacetate synthase ThiH
MVRDIKSAVPDMHIHGFTPLEIWQGAETINMDIEEYLKLLKTAGLIHFLEQQQRYLMTGSENIYVLIK